MRARPLLLALALLALLAPRGAAAASITGGALNAVGERSQNFGVGYPELFWAYEFRVTPKAAFAVRVGLQVWPLSLTLGPWIRLSLHERDKVAISLLIHPSLNLAGFGGSRAFYPSNANLGRSRFFRPSGGPGINLGLLATVVLSRQWDLLVSFENPVALWIWSRPAELWLEWPLMVSVGIEYELSYKISLFARVGGGPSFAFDRVGPRVGAHGNGHLGIQIRF